MALRGCGLLIAVASLLAPVACNEEPHATPPEPVPAPSEPATVTEVADVPPTNAADAAAVAIVGSGPAASAGLSSSASPLASASVSADPLTITVPREPSVHSFEEGPFYFTAGFDGSLRYSLWLRTMAFSRRMAGAYQRAPHFTYFVNAAFFSTSPGKSDVGKAMSRAEVLVRRALAQEAINEGHEIANHGAGHLDGRFFDRMAWLNVFERFHQIMASAVFEPIPNGEGEGFVFPRFDALSTAPVGELGAACSTDSDCTSKRCVFPTAGQGICSEPCNLKQKCQPGFACGAPMFRSDTDLCLPVPTFPVELDGQTLFDAKGEPNFKHPKLKPYKIVGFRAPYLGANNELYEALFERSYEYDTSQSASPGPPFAFRDQPRTKSVLEFPLTVHQGVLTIPMDYNYAQLKATPERMFKDYKTGIAGAIAGKRVPFNIGHHFAMWSEGGYLKVLEDTVEYVLAGCNAGAEAQCPQAEVVSFRELAGSLLHPITKP